MLKNRKKHWKYDVLKHGYNYRLSDINCALGLSQLKKIRIFLKKRKKIYEKYFTELNKFNSNLILPKYNKNTIPSYHLYLINIQFNKLNKEKNHKDYFMSYLFKNGIIAQQHYIPIYKFKVYKKKIVHFCGSEKYFNNSVSIPIYVNLNHKEQIRIIEIIKKYFNK